MRPSCRLRHYILETTTALFDAGEKSSNAAITETFLTSTTTKATSAAGENFADLLSESFGDGTNIEGSVVRGFVIGMDSEAVIIDVGLKSEGRVPLKELAAPGQNPTGGHW